MTLTHASWRSLVAVGATAVAFVLIAVTGWVVSTDRLFTRGLDVAFDDHVPAPAARSGATPELDPSALQLSSWAVAPRPVVDPLVKVGDRVTISGADGRARVLEIVSSRELGSEFTRVENGRDARLVLVTSRVVGEPGQLIRFVIEAPMEKGQPGATAAVHRAL